MTQESVTIAGYCYDPHPFPFAPGDTSSAIDGQGWFSRLAPRSPHCGDYEAGNGVRDSVLGLVSELSRTEQTASVPLTLRQNEWDVPGEISDEAILAEMVRYEPHELVVRIPPKRTRIIRARGVIRVKARPRPIEPEDYGL